MTDGTDPVTDPIDDSGTGPAGGLGAEAAAYLSAVRAGLFDLEPEEQEEMLDDLASHLHEVRAAGVDRPLVELLGPPERYAAELRTAAGLAAGPSQPAAARPAAPVAGTVPVSGAVPSDQQVLVGAGVVAGVAGGPGSGAGVLPPPPPPPPTGGAGSPPPPSLPPPPSGPWAGQAPPPGASPPPPPYRPGDALGRAVGDAAERVTGHRWWQGVTGFLPELVPAWWVARAWLAVAVLAAITSGDAFIGGGPILLPRLFGSFLLGLAVLAAAIVWSVRWGRSRRDRAVPPQAGIVTGAVILAGMVIVLLGLSFVAARSSSYPTYTDAAETIVGPLPPALAETSDTALNVYAYRPDGTPVGPVLLYDESGRPLVVGGFGDGEPGSRSVDAYSDGLVADVEVVAPIDANGNPVPNQYPRQLFVPDQGPNGERIRHPVPPPQVVLPPPTLAPTSSTAPPTTATTAPAGSASTAPESTATTAAPSPTPSGDPSTTSTTTP